MKRALVVLMLVFAAPAHADPPSAVTGPAEVLAAGAVNGTGTINDDGHAAAWYFEYAAPWYTYKTKFQPIAASTGDQQVTLPLDIISPGTAYRYRLVLQTAVDYVYGDWVEFTTPDAPLKSGPPRVPITISEKPLRIAHDHTLPVLITCLPWSTGCNGTVAVKKSDAQGAPSITRRVHFDIRPGKRRRIRLGLARAGRQLRPADDGRYLFIEIRDLWSRGSLTGALRELSLK